MPCAPHRALVCGTQVTFEAVDVSATGVRGADDGRSGTRRNSMTEASSQQAAEELANGRQPLWTQFRLGWRRTYYNMAQALGLKRLQDLLQVLEAPIATAPIASHPVPS